jgi:hypothetical protein
MDIDQSSLPALSDDEDSPAGDMSPVSGVAAQRDIPLPASSTQPSYDDNIFRRGIAAVLDYIPRDVLPPVESPKPPEESYTVSAPKREPKRVLKRLPFSEGFCRAFNAFQHKTLDLSQKIQSEVGTRADCDENFLIQLGKANPSVRTSHKYDSARVVFHRKLQENTGLYPLVHDETQPFAKSSAVVPGTQLIALETAARAPLFAASYMDWAVAASQMATTQLQTLSDKISTLDNLSDESTKLAVVTKDLATLARLPGRDPSGSHSIPGTYGRVSN